MHLTSRLFCSALCVVALIASVPLCVRADGLMRGAHVNGPYTTLVLTKEQRAQLKRKKDRIILTPNQQLVMRASTGVVGVTKVLVLPKTTRTCTCELHDVAAQISTDKIEVANSQFGLDFDMFRYNYPYWSKINKAESEEDAIKTPPEEVRFRKAASTLGPEAVTRSSELLKKAIAINPDYTLGRQLLALNYTEYSSKDQPLNQRKSAYEEAIALVQDRDAELEKHLRIQLSRIEAMIDARKKLLNLKQPTISKGLK
jgi:hypothetical protein